MSEITQAELRALFDYDPETGLLIRRIARAKNAPAGRPAGHINRSGYRVIVIRGKRYLAHRLVWAHQYGRFPELSIDHINGDRSDNRIENLREVPHAWNCQNLRRPSKNNRAGILGVHENRGKFVAMIYVGGKSKYLGRFATAEQASRAYRQAKADLHPGVMA